MNLSIGELYLGGYVIALLYMVLMDIRVGLYFRRDGLRGAQQWAVVDYAILPTFWFLWPFLGAPEINA